MQTKNNLKIKVMRDNSHTGIVILIDDGYNPVMIALSVEDAEKLNKEINLTIERIKNEHERN